MKYVYFDFADGLMTVDDFDTQSPTTFGHSNAAGSEAVGAAAWYNTAEWGPAFHPACVPACAEIFSSAGGTPILFDINGKRLKKPIVRVKPGVVGPDGGNTSFSSRSFRSKCRAVLSRTNSRTSLARPRRHLTWQQSLPSCSTGATTASPREATGRSAQAPSITRSRRCFCRQPQLAQRVAAGARFRACDAITPQKINDILRDTAEDMTLAAGRVTEPFVVGKKGFDPDTGHGFVNAVRAITEAKKH